MKFASLALFVAGVLAQSKLTINTPANVVECQPTLLSWTGGVAPYYLVKHNNPTGASQTQLVSSILPGATPNGAAIEQLPQTNDTSITWTCNIQANTNIGLTLRDSTGTVAQSAPFVINAGTSTSCLNTTSVAPGPTGGSPPSAAPSGTSPTSAAAGTTPAGTTPAGTIPGSPISAAPAAATTTRNAAAANVAQIGAAGVVGAAVAALFL